jgi:hypothetical protein
MRKPGGWKARAKKDRSRRLSNISWKAAVTQPSTDICERNNCSRQREPDSQGEDQYRWNSTSTLI